MASASISKLADKVLRSEERDKRVRLRDKLTKEKLVGSGTAIVVSALGGYLDGKFDILGTDTTAGDGMHVFGIPVMPVAALAALAGGLMFSGPLSTQLSYGGLGLLCYSAGSLAKSKA